MCDLCLFYPFLSSKVLPVLLMFPRTQATINGEKCKSLSDLVVGCLIGCGLGGCLDGAFIFSQPECLRRSSSARAGHAEKVSPRQVRKGRAEKKFGTSIIGKIP